MDQVKIGKFIAEMRKEQNLTQIDLAEQLGISNKTISKWECGNGMPDYAVMENLCDILKINVNELLSGERLPSQDYNKKAEENIMNLMQESSENYKREKRDIVFAFLGIAVLLFVVVLTITTFGGMAAITDFIDMPTFIYIFITFVLVLGAAGLLKDFGKAFPTAFRTDFSINKQQIQKSILAIKVAIIGVNVAGVLSFLIGLVESLKKWSDVEKNLEFLAIWTAVALLSMVYALVITLLLTPIYARLRKKLIEG